MPAVAVAALLLLGAGAAPALADDDVEIDERLDDAGFEGAFTNYAFSDPNGVEGVRVNLDFVSDSASLDAFDAEAREAAALLWEHLEMHMLALDVSSSYGVTWLGGDLPGAVSFTRSELAAAFGPRPDGLDDEGAGYYAEQHPEDEAFASGAFDGQDASPGWLAVGLGSAAALAVGAGGGGLTGYLLGRRNGRTASAAGWGTSPQPGWYGGYPAGGTPAPGGWAPVSPAPAPGGWPGSGAPAQGGWSGPQPGSSDTWRTP